MGHLRQQLLLAFVNPAIFAPALTGSATIPLTERTATSVIGNQVRSVPFFTSVDFDNMPGPFMGNVPSRPIGAAPRLTRSCWQLQPRSIKHGSLR